MILEESTWEEAKDEFNATKLAIVPIGATECHGLHNPLGIESFIVEELAKRLEKRLNVIVTPTIPISLSRGWSEFPGTLWVNHATLKAYLKEVCDCLILNGIKNLFFINGHRPNIQIIEELSHEFAKVEVACAQIDLWRFIGSISKDLGETELPMGHSGELPTSIIMAIKKDYVRMNKTRLEKPRETLQNIFPSVIQYYSNSIKNPFGFEGDPSKANEEKGIIILERCVKRLEEFLTAWVTT
jgi:creatinine amidohydrolase